MRVFALKTCDTCRKALKTMREAGFEPEVIDVRADGVPDADRAAILAGFGEAALNKASTTWRGLDDAEKAKPADILLAEHPTLMKRPVIEKDGQWYMGWKADVQRAVIG